MRQIKRSLKFFLALLVTTIALPGAFAQEEEDSLPSEAPPEKVAVEASTDVGSFNLGVEYRSKYYSRGQWFYGAAAGVFLPYISYSKNSTYFFVGGEFGESLVFGSADVNESGFGEVEEDWRGVDFGVVYNTNYEDWIDLSFGAWYYWYYKSRALDPNDIGSSFADLRASMSFSKVFLSPTISYSHYLRPEKSNGVPSKEDYYISVSLSHKYPVIEGASVRLGGELGYYNYASQKQSPFYGKVGEIPAGISDAVVHAAFTYTLDTVTFGSSFNYAYVLHEKFDYTSGRQFDKSKFWTSFSVDYAF